ncbi:MAG TPA: FAD-dependent monooxygenase [Steroidobacteraceae bacterium]|nr:FAD-dependent monooxygenase [Steroidobacteraceae bacterium]
MPKALRVAINGAGIAGPTLAYWLRQLGHAPMLFEKAACPRAGGFVIDFWGSGYDVAERMGLIDQFAARAHAIDCMRLVDANGNDRAVLDVGPIRANFGGRLLSVSRNDIASTILAACDGIPIHFGSSIWNIEQDRGGVTIRLANGQLERFDLLIGADGLHSQVRALAFAPQKQAERPLGCYVAAFRIANYPHGEKAVLASHTRPGQYVARISVGQSETLILMVCGARLLGRPPRREQQREALRFAFGDMKWEVPTMLEAMEEVDDLYFDRVSQIRLPSWSNGRIALVGDAASCPSFLAGAGCALAMTQAYILAGEISVAEGDHQRAFARYEETLRPSVRATQRSAHFMKGYFTPRTAAGLQVRDLIVRLLSNPLLAGPLLRRTLAPTLTLPSYPLS